MNFSLHFFTIISYLENMENHVNLYHQCISKHKTHVVYWGIKNVDIYLNHQHTLLEEGQDKFLPFCIDSVSSTFALEWFHTYSPQAQNPINKTIITSHINIHVDITYIYTNIKHIRNNLDLCLFVAIKTSLKQKPSMEGNPKKTKPNKMKPKPKPWQHAHSKKM